MLSKEMEKMEITMPPQVYNLDRCQQQVERFMVNMNVNELTELFVSDKITWQSIMPTHIKSEKLLEGKKSEVGCKFETEEVSGIVCRCEMTKMDAKNGTFTYRVSSQNIPGLKGLKWYDATFVLKPITFNGCPYTQAIMDTQAKADKNSLWSGLTCVEWIC
mmetsp:Transcript_17439/g.29344  ORF Transcript_17439/g.29344 Transcript_17439/m.29344 type:complete len:161 (+) Transcript_17439:134-616(+)